MDDAQLVESIADFIAAYRAAGKEAPAMLQAVLAHFPRATGDDYAIGLLRANRRRAAQ